MFFSRANSTAAAITRWLVVLALLGPLPARSQEAIVPMRVQYPLLLKAISFDRNLKSRCRNAIVLGILYQSKYKRSLELKEEFLNAATDSAALWVENLPVRIVPIDLSSLVVIEEVMVTKGINTLCVAPLRSVDLKRIVAVTRKRKVLSLTGVSRYVESGVSIGVESKDDRPTLVVNLKGSKAEGADIDSELLELTRTIK